MKAFILIGLLALAQAALAAQAADKPLVLGIHPYLQESELIRRFTPLARYLEQSTGETIRVKVATNYRQHIESIGNDQIDIAFMGPAPYVQMTAEFGLKPLLARLEDRGQPYFRGHILVRDDSPIKRLEDLDGRRFAFGDPESTMSSLIPQYLLGRHRVQLAGKRHYDSHKNVALAVLIGEADAGAVKEEIYWTFREQGLRSLVATEPMSEHLFVTSGNLAEPVIAKLRQAMLELAPDQVEKVLQPVKSSRW